MEAFESTWIWVLFVFAVVIGFILTGVYYFSRYYFKINEKDREVLKPLYPIHPKVEQLERVEPVEVHDSKQSQSLSDHKLKSEVINPDNNNFSNLKADISLSNKDLDLKLANTKKSFWGRIKDQISNGNLWESSDFESLEEILYTSDLGPQTVQRLNNTVLGKFKKSQLKDINVFRDAIKSEMKTIFSEVSESFVITLSSPKDRLACPNLPSIRLRYFSSS